MPILPRLVSWFLRSDGPLISVLVGLIPGLLFSQFVWGGFGWLDAPYWAAGGFPDSGDVHAGLGAEQHFINAPWGLPLFALQTIAPQGEPLSLLATDAIALTALIGKLLASIGISANLYALWFIVVPPLQGAAAGLFAWSLGGGGRIRPLAAALLALSYGHWLQKSAIHPINAGHFTLLIALALVAAIVTGRVGARRGVVLSLLLVPLALLQTPYLAAMVIMIGLGTILAALRAGLARRDALFSVGALVLMLAIALPLGGWTSFADEWRGGSDDYGNLGSNALALLWPTRFPLIPALQIDPFRLPVIGGQDIDSEVFIGAAALLLLIVGLARSIRPGTIARLRRFSPLIVGAGAAWLFSLTNNIGIGPIQLRLFELPEPIAPLFHAFRWSSRFAWPAAYLLMIGGLLLASAPLAGAAASRVRRLLPASLALLVAVAGLGQALNNGDIGGIRDLTRHYPTSYGERDFANRILEGSSALALYPSHVCFSDMGVDEMSYDADRLMRDQHTYWMVATGRRGISTTAAKLNRGIDAPCYGPDGYAEVVTRALTTPGTALALHGRLGRALEAVPSNVAERCVVVPGVTVCTPGSLPSDPWIDLAGLRLSDLGVPLLDYDLLGDSLFASDLRLSALLAWGEGFSRNADDETLRAIWVPRSDPRVAETDLPVTAGPGLASITAATRIERSGERLELVIEALSASRLRIDGRLVDLAIGERFLIASDRPLRCSETSCAQRAEFELLYGNVELLGVEIP